IHITRSHSAGVLECEGADCVARAAREVNLHDAAAGWWRPLPNVTAAATWAAASIGHIDDPVGAQAALCESGEPRVRTATRLEAIRTEPAHASQRCHDPAGHSNLANQQIVLIRDIEVPIGAKRAAANRTGEVCRCAGA